MALGKPNPAVLQVQLTPSGQCPPPPVLITRGGRLVARFVVIFKLCWMFGAPWWPVGRSRAQRFPTVCSVWLVTAAC